MNDHAASVQHAIKAKSGSHGIGSLRKYSRVGCHHAGTSAMFIMLTYTRNDTNLAESRPSTIYDVTVYGISQVIPGPREPCGGLGLGGGDEEHNSEESERDWTMGCWGNHQPTHFAFM